MCIHICVYTLICVYERVFVCACESVCVHLYYICMNMRVLMYIYSRLLYTHNTPTTHTKHKKTHTDTTYKDARTHIYIWIQIYVYIYTHPHFYTHIFMCLCACIAFTANKTAAKTGDILILGERIHICPRTVLHFCFLHNNFFVLTLIISNTLSSQNSI